MSTALAEVLCDSVQRPSIILPIPSGPLVRQCAVGALSSPEIYLPDTTPDYFDWVRAPAVLSIPTVVIALQESLPATVQPHVKYIPRKDRFGTTFTLFLKEESEALCKDERHISEVSLCQQLAWEYIACMYIRFKIGGKGRLNLSRISSNYHLLFLKTTQHMYALNKVLSQCLLA
jgi:hypothetical protein